MPKISSLLLMFATTSVWVGWLTNNKAVIKLSTCAVLLGVSQSKKYLVKKCSTKCIQCYIYKVAYPSLPWKKNGPQSQTSLVIKGDTLPPERFHTFFAIDAFKKITGHQIVYAAEALQGKAIIADHNRVIECILMT